MSLLRAHQIAGAEWLAKRPRAYLADAPRVGKTRTILAALQRIGARRPLIVCPAIVRSHWAREAAALGVEAPFIYSFDGIRIGGDRLMAQLILREKIDALVIDEAHNCKSVEAQRAKQLLGRDGYARRLEIVWPASGTPIQKHPGDLWTIMGAVFPEVALRHGCRTQWEWWRKFCVVDWEAGKPISGCTRNPEELREILAEVMLRRTLDDLGADVPPVDFQVTYVDAVEDPLTSEPIFGHLMAAIEAGELESVAMEPHVMRMRRRIGELKVPAMVGALRAELEASSEKLVVFAHHTTVLDALHQGLADYDVAFVDGRTSQPARDTAMDRFQNDPRCRVFLGQNIACKEGITLSAARRAILVEPDWTAVVNEQLGNRVLDANAPGRHCVAEMVALADTLDEAIVGQNAREVRMLRKVLA